MAANGLALITYAVLALMLLVGVLVIAAGLVARRRGGGGTSLIVIGAVIALIPVGFVGSTLVARQLS